MIELIVLIIWSIISIFTYFKVVKGKGMTSNEELFEEIIVSVLWPFLFLLLGIWSLTRKISGEKYDDF